MSSESWSANPTPPHKSLESLKKTYKTKLDAILDEQLTVENIESFANDALSRTIQLTEDVLRDYGRNPNFKASPSTLNNQEQENEAFSVLGLPNIQEILNSILEVKKKVDSLKNYLNTGKENIDTVITPPQENGRMQTSIGSGSFKEKKMYPRLLTLLYILEHDFEIEPANVKITEGTTTSNMMRNAPYVRVEIPDMERAVYICDEEGNVSYVFDTAKLKEAGLTLEEIDVDDKGDKNSLIAYHPGIGIRIIQSKSWRSYLSEALKEPIKKLVRRIEEEREEDILKNPEDKKEGTLPVASRGELDPWRGFWTDPVTGEHWGTKFAMAKKLNRAYIVFNKRILDKRLKIFSIKIGGSSNRVEDGYCFEQVIELFPELIPQERSGQTKGEWRGFWTDPETGKHWAPAGTVQNKFNVKDWVTIKKFAKRGNFKTTVIADLLGRKTEGYCYEDYMENEEFMDFLTAPEVSESGKWTGFWVDDKNQHWAPISVLVSYFNSTHITVQTYIKKMNLIGKKVKSRYKEVLVAFPMESLANNEEFMDFLNLPEVEKNGEWVGFWTEPQTELHWGTILPIARKLKTDRRKITQLIQNYHLELKTKQIKIQGGQQFNGYCLEEIEKILG